MSASGLWIAVPPAPNLRRRDWWTHESLAPVMVVVVPDPANANRPHAGGRPGATGPGGAVPGVHDGLDRCAYPENPIGEVTGEPSARPRLSLEAQQNVEAIKVWPPPLPAVQVIPHPLQHTARKETHPFLVNVSPSPRGLVVEEIGRACERDAGRVAVPDVEQDVHIVRPRVIGSLDEIGAPGAYAVPVETVKAPAGARAAHPGNPARRVVRAQAGVYGLSVAQSVTPTTLGLARNCYP